LAEVDSGADVQQLNADLVALGDASATQLSPQSGNFSAATVAAVDKLQASIGAAETGSLALGQVVFLPSAVRVTTVTATVGGAVNGGQKILQATSTGRVVTVNLDAALQSEIKVGDAVSITLPGGKTTPGRVTSTGTIATTAPGDRPGTSGPTTVAVDVTPNDPAATGIVDQVPVAVSITLASVGPVLAVPVAALTTTTGGQPAVLAVGADGTSHLEPVSVGLFDDDNGLVEIHGAGLTDGDHVVIPSS
jgi:hypothetical protein